MSTIAPAPDALLATTITLRRIVADLASAGEAVLSAAVGRQADRVETGEPAKIGWAHDGLVSVRKFFAMSAAVADVMDEAIAATAKLDPPKAVVLERCAHGMSKAYEDRSGWDDADRGDPQRARFRSSSRLYSRE